MQPWFQFYAVIAGAAATLLGLLFVSVSVNAAVILGAGHENTRHLAEQAFQNYVAVMTVSLLALFPGISTPMFSWVALSLIALSAGWVLARVWLVFVRRSDREPLLPFLRRYLSSLIGFGMLTFAALRMALGLGGERNLFAASDMVLLLSATNVSWELLIRISRARSLVQPPNPQG